ncbi:MAG TPA: DUF4175 family protein [Vicinamibacterales bacterium]|jgi:hypothetical protein
MQGDLEIREFIARVRRRWRTQQSLRAVARAALFAAIVVGLAFALSRLLGTSPAASAALGVVGVLGVAAVALWAFLPLRKSPDDHHVARFIEEHEPSLDDRLVSAVDVASHESSAPGLSGPMLADAARRLRDVDLESILSSAVLRRAAMLAGGAAAVMLLMMFAARHAARQSFDAFALTVFPTRIALEVTPGDAHVKAGTPLTVEARLVGNTAPVEAQFQVADGDGWRSADMTTAAPGLFRLPLEAVWTSFKYRVAAGAVVSRTYDLVAVRPPHVARIDVDYTYPAGLNLPPRTEKDSGDIYAPAGTDVRLHVITDSAAASGQMSLANGQTIALSSAQPKEWLGSIKVTNDSSYRVALTDSEGLSAPGDTEYFIRVLEDRPPDVRVTRPASDRAVTRLEEVDVEAQAEDDYGIDKLDLVYSVRGETEKTVPLSIPKNQASVTGHHTLFLEDLDVKPGDFISYYVRARDLTRGTRPNEARSDIFFLEVKPYEQEFALAQSQMASAGGGGHGSIDDLVAAQKEIIVATWKIDRRAQMSKGGKSEQDIKAVAKAQAELKTRVEQTSSGFRENTMRDPRRRPQSPRGGRGGQPPPEPLKAGQTMPEEDEMTAAVQAMGDAASALDALKTTEARPPEMEALNHLLKAQADVKKRDVQRQQAGTGAGSNRSNYDLSSLFDKELQKQQQTNYETRSSAEERKDPAQSALDKIRDLAARQDELLKRQRELAAKRGELSQEELRRELEKLTRDQSELRQRAEDLARQMQNQSGSQSDQKPQQTPGQTAQGSQNAQGSQPSQGSQGAQSSQGSRNGQSSQQMRDVTDAMRNAASELRQQDPSQAAKSTASATRALEALRNLERQMQSGQPDEKRRAVGEMQLEARQLADAQRQVAAELGKTPTGEPGKDALRRLAGEQERLADRARRLQDSLKQQNATAEAGRDIERQGLPDRMQKSADAMRSAAERTGAPSRGSSAPTATSQGADEARGQTGTQQEMARAFDKLADRLGTVPGGNKDSEAAKLSGQLARAQQLQERLDQLTSEMQRLDAQGSQSGQRGGARGAQGQSGGDQSSSASKAAGESGRAGQGQGAGVGAGAPDLQKLRDEAQRAMQETRDLMDQLRREDPSLNRGGAGFTFEGQGMTTSAPGTEAFKQDFARWNDLRRQATQALENAQSTLTKKLQAKESKERLAAGANDQPPAGYQQQVDEYFKAIAAKKKGS